MSNLWGFCRTLAEPWSTSDAVLCAGPFHASVFSSPQWWSCVRVATPSGGSCWRRTGTEWPAGTTPSSTSSSSTAPSMVTLPPVSPPAAARLSKRGCETGPITRFSRYDFHRWWCSVAQLCLTLRPHGLQHTRLPCPSVSPGVCSNSCPLSPWSHPAISSSVASFFSCLQSLPASGSFLMSWVFASGGQITGASASASVLPVSNQGLFPLRLTGFGLLSVQDSQESSTALQFEDVNSLALCLLYGTGHTIICDHWEDLDYRDFVSRVMALLFNTLYVCHGFPAKKQSSSDFMVSVTICSDFGAQEEEICHYFYLFLFYLS